MDARPRPTGSGGPAPRRSSRVRGMVLAIALLPLLVGPACDGGAPVRPGCRPPELAVEGATTGVAVAEGAAATVVTAAPGSVLQLVGRHLTVGCRRPAVDRPVQRPRAVRLDFRQGTTVVSLGVATVSPTGAFRATVGVPPGAVPGPAAVAARADEGGGRVMATLPLVVAGG